MWGVVGAVIAVLGGWALLRTDISVEPYIVLDPANAFSEQFKVQNNGLFSIYNVSVSCVFKYIENSSGGGMRNVGFGNIAGAEEIPPNRSTTIKCPASAYDIVKADIEIDVDFTRKWWDGRM